MSLPSEYQIFHDLADRGFDPIRISMAVDVLTGRHRADDDQADDDGPGWDDSRWDDERWTVTEPFIPNPEDEEWLSRHQLTDEDLEAMARDAAWLDHLEGLARVTDEDVARVNCAG